jgi:hypothetical protein
VARRNFFKLCPAFVVQQKIKGVANEEFSSSKSTYMQGASGIDARFLKLSPASAVSPIMTKISQYTPHSTCYLVLVFICWQD